MEEDDRVSLASGSGNSSSGSEESWDIIDEEDAAEAPGVESQESSPSSQPTPSTTSAVQDLVPETQASSSSCKLPILLCSQFPYLKRA